MSKKVYAYIAGQTAPAEKRMGHAGAIISRGKGTAESKIKAFDKVGVPVAILPSDISKLLKGQI
ncbi:MAG: succinate--CoA ligase subunit alpha, partial [Thermoplasmata archaeon]|nr:succinate--CoA ligase subunit alpha [Thermoplasmata archaeon]